MNTFSDELRRERVSRNISLADISSQTHINIKFLEALEQGSFDILPQSYIRAFLREYAISIELPSDEILRKYDIMVGGKYSGSPSSFSGSGYAIAPVPAMSNPAERSDSPENAVLQQSNPARNKHLRGAIIVLILIAAVVVLSLIISKFESSAPTQETPFRDVVRENESALSRDPAPPPPALNAFPGDSLLLKVSILDTVHVSIKCDEEKILYYRFPPRTIFFWKAEKRFIISIGKANAVQMTFNGRIIVPPADSIGQTRGFQLSRATAR